MVRGRGRRNFEPVDDDEFDDTFIVSGEETFFIDNRKVVVEDAVHAIKDGQEYVIIGDRLYPITQSNNPYSEPAGTGSSLGSLILVFIVSFAVVFFGGAFIFGMVNGSSDDSGNENIISPGENLENTITVEPTKVQSSESQKATKIENAMDYTNPITRDYAVSLIPNSHEGKYNIAQICDLWDTVYKKWTYVNDPKGSDYYSPASRTIEIGLKGDCDDFAITVGSLVQSIGGSSRIVTAYNEQGGHAYPEVMICTNKACMDNVAKYIGKRYNAKSIAYHTRTKDGVTQYWMNLDWQSQYPGGKFFHDSGEMTIYYPNGYWYKSG